MYLIALMQMKVLLLVVVVAVVIETASACGCNYHNGGCNLDRPAERGFACKCFYRVGFWTCGGRQVACSDPNHELCNFPTLSREACEFGGGNCKGY
jgi:hypothetical protein